MQAHDPAFDGAGEDADEAGSAPARFLEDSRYEPAEMVEQAQLSEQASEGIASALDALDERSRDIVTRRWLREPKAKLRELAQTHGISAERVRQIESEAFATMRNSVERSALPAPRAV